MHLRGEKVEIKKTHSGPFFPSSLSLGAKRNNRRVQIYPIWAEREREKCEISVCVQDGAGRLLRLRKKINRPPRSLTKEKNRKGGETPTTPPKKRNKGGQKKSRVQVPKNCSRFLFFIFRIRFELATPAYPEEETGELKLNKKKVSSHRLSSLVVRPRLQQRSKTWKKKGKEEKKTRKKPVISFFAR